MAHKAAHYQLCLFVLYVQPLGLDTGICRMYTRMNNPLNQFITAGEVDFVKIKLSILISVYFPFYYWRSSERKILEKSQIIATYNHYILSKY